MIQKYVSVLLLILVAGATGFGLGYEVNDNRRDSVYLKSLQDDLKVVAEVAETTHKATATHEVKREKEKDEGTSIVRRVESGAIRLHVPVVPDSRLCPPPTTTSVDDGAAPDRYDKTVTGTISSITAARLIEIGNECNEAKQALALCQERERIRQRGASP